MASPESKTAVIYPELKGKRALITGAGKGIGRDCVRELWEQGCHVIAVSRTQSDLDSLTEQCQSKPVIDGQQIITKAVDITSRTQVEEWFETLPAINFLINNAAIVRPQKFVDVTEEEYDLVTGVNFKAQFHFGQLAARNMIANEIKGVIINVSSVAGRKALPYTSTYCCSKAALNMLTQVMTVELAQYGIRAVSLCPGFVWTEMLKTTPNAENFLKQFQEQHPYCKIGDVEDISRVVSFHLSHNACMITGSISYLDSGLFA